MTILMMESLEVGVEDMLFVVDGVLQIPQLPLQPQPPGVSQSEVQLPQTHEVLLQQAEVDLHDEFLLHHLRFEQKRELEGVADFLGSDSAVHVAEQTHHRLRKRNYLLFQNGVVLLGGRKQGEVAEVEEGPAQRQLPRPLEKLLQLAACAFPDLPDCRLNQVLEVSQLPAALLVQRPQILLKFAHYLID